MVFFGSYLSRSSIKNMISLFCILRCCPSYSRVQVHKLLLTEEEIPCLWFSPEQTTTCSQQQMLTCDCANMLHTFPLRHTPCRHTAATFCTRTGLQRASSPFSRLSIHIYQHLSHTESPRGAAASPSHARVKVTTNPLISCQGKSHQC